MDHNMPNIGSASKNHEENPPPPPQPQEDHQRPIQQRTNYVPLSVVTRIMREQLPPPAKISDDAKETLQECVSKYIYHVAYAANRKCHREYRKKVTPDDLMSALAELGFNEYVEPLSVWLNGIRAQERRDGTPASPRRNVRARDEDPSPSTARGTGARNDDGPTLGKNIREA